MQVSLSIAASVFLTVKGLNPLNAHLSAMSLSLFLHDSSLPSYNSTPSGS